VVAPLRFPSAGGAEVAVHDLGGSGPPLLLSHATGMHGRAYEPMVATLGRRFHCLALDLRGHGDSRVGPRETYEWAGFATDLLAAVDGLGLRDVHAFGHSMGGTTIVTAELARPGLFRGAYLFEPILLPPGYVSGAQGPDTMVGAARRRQEVFPSRRAALERYSAKPPWSEAAPEALAAYVEHGFADRPDGSVILKCRGAVEAEVFENSRGNGAFERLPELRFPVTVAAAADGGPPAEFAAMAAAAIPGARLERLLGVTHFAPFEDPARLAAAALAAFGAG
jgi:pimeloyl-ACP methyl ester carboxylesterase